MPAQGPPRRACGGQGRSPRPDRRSARSRARPPAGADDRPACAHRPRSSRVVATRRMSLRPARTGCGFRQARRIAVEPRRRAGKERRHHRLRVFGIGERPALRRRVERDAEAVVAGRGDRGVAAERLRQARAPDRSRRDARRAAARRSRRPPRRRAPAARRACRKGAARGCGSGCRRRRCRRWAGLRRRARGGARQCR